MDLDMALSGSTGWDFTVTPDGWAGYSQQAISLHPLTSPVPFLSVMLKLFIILFLPSVHHVLAHCSSSCCRWAMWLVGPYVTSSVYAAWHGGELASSCLQPSLVAWQWADLRV